MTVSEALLEIRNDPMFQLRPYPEALVTVGSIRLITGQGDSCLVVTVLPTYPSELAMAGVNGEVTAEVSFRPGNVRPEVKIVNSSLSEFEAATSWALSRWELRGVASEADGARVDRRYECRIEFKVAYD